MSTPKFVIDSKYKNHIRAKKRLDIRNSDTAQARRAAAHQEAFSSVIDFINSHIIEQNEVVQFSTLWALYIKELEKYVLPKPDRRVLKRRLRVDKISEKIAFAKVNSSDKGFVTFNLVYNSSLQVEEALSHAYTFGSRDKFKDVALLLRGVIQQAFSKSKSLPWPPTADDPEINSEGVLPPGLTKFLNIVISGEESVGEMCVKTHLLVLSIVQDLCRAVTNGEWKLPKHILLCCTVRHLYHSRQLTTILNRLGHSESYDFGLELETAMAKATDEMSTYLTPKIITGEVENDTVYKECLMEYRVWILLGMMGSSGNQPVPAFGGFISATGTKPARKSSIDNFTPINQPFTEYSVIQELLRQSEEATAEVGQKYVLSTSDLGGCMKALPLIWKFPERYKLHVITPEAFHTGMNYMGMVTGHKFRGSDYAEVILKAGLITSGCLNSVLSGKAYAKALFCLKTVCEAMERLLMERFVEEENIQVENIMSLLNLVKSCNREHLNLAMQDTSTVTIINKYIEFEDKVSANHLGKTGNLWFGFIKHIRLILMLIYSVKTNNLKLFHKCNGEMANLFFAFDGPNYSRYLVWLEVFHTNLELSHPGAKDLLERGGISVARSLIPGALSAVDKTMEETFMKLAKSAGDYINYSGVLHETIQCFLFRNNILPFSGGLGGLFSMFGAYQHWCHTTSARTQYFERLLEMCGLIDDTDCPTKSGKHRELEAAEIKKSEEAVQKTLSTIRNFIDPFTVSDKDHLYNIAFGATVPLEVETDVM
ncbi:hypothetical protein ABVT39_003386 [Epinephelus coioides]